MDISYLDNDFSDEPQNNSSIFWQKQIQLLDECINMQKQEIMLLETSLQKYVILYENDSSSFLDLKKDYSSLQNEYVKLKNERDEFSQQLVAIQNSRTWKLRSWFVRFLRRQQ